MFSYVIDLFWPVVELDILVSRSCPTYICNSKIISVGPTKTRNNFRIHVRTRLCDAIQFHLLIGLRSCVTRCLRGVHS